MRLGGLLLAIALLAGCSGQATPHQDVLLDTPSSTSSAPSLDHDPSVPTATTTTTSTSSGPTTTTPQSTTSHTTTTGPVVPDYPRFAATTPMTSNPGLHEESLAVAHDGRTLIACDASEHGTGTGPAANYHVSSDGGATWKDVLGTPASTDPRSLLQDPGNDCDTAIDAAGTLYVADAWRHGVAILTSTDQGATWTLQSVAAGTDVAAEAASGVQLVYHRPWLIAGAAGHVGLVFRSWDPGGSPAALHYTVTTDGGRTFAASTVIASGAFVAGGPASSADGSKIWVPFRQFSATAAPAFGIYASTDSGQTWTRQDVAPAGPPGTVFPSLAVDAGGNLHLVDCQQVASSFAAFYWSSRDGGHAWSAATRLSPNATAQDAWVAGGADGQAAVTWLGGVPGAPPTDRYLYWARITSSGVVVATTSAKPVYAGGQPAPPEFGMVRLDGSGMMHLGYAVPAPGGWQAMYQGQTGGPAT